MRIMRIQHTIFRGLACGLATLLMIIPPAYSLQSEQFSPQEQNANNKEATTNDSVTASTKLDGFRGLQLLPSQDNKWIPTQTFDDLVKKAGILNLQLGLVTVTNAFSEPGSQLGAGLKFSFEMVMIKRLDGAFLLLNATGNSTALFDPNYGGRQVYPSVSRLVAKEISPNSVELAEAATKATLRFQALPFSNYRGEQIYLLSQVTSPAGKPFAISYTVDQTTKTARYSRFGLYRIVGDKESGKISFQRSDLPGVAFSLTYTDNMVTGFLGAAGEKHYDITTNSDGLVTSLTDRYGYKTSFSYAQGLWTGSCDHFGACSSLAFGAGTFTSTSNISNYEVQTRFDPQTGLATEKSFTVPTDPTYQGGRTTYSYEPAQSQHARVRFRLVKTEFTLGERPKVVTSYTYDTHDRLVKQEDSLNSTTAYGYMHQNSPFHEPTSIKSELAGNVTFSVSLAYDLRGQVIRYQDHLVKKGAPESEISFGYDAQGRVARIRYGDGTKRTTMYDNSAFPDRATTVLTNGFGVMRTFDPSGLITSLTHIPSQSQITANYNQAGMPTNVVASFPTMSAKTEWSGSYSDNLYLTSEKVRETNQGVAATTYAATYTWDSLYRDVVKMNADKPDLNYGLKNASTFPFVEGNTGDQSQESDGESQPSGVREDATKCLPCSGRAFYDPDGALIPEDLACNRSVTLVSPPPDVSDSQE